MVAPPVMAGSPGLPGVVLLLPHGQHSGAEPESLTARSAGRVCEFLHKFGRVGGARFHHLAGRSINPVDTGHRLARRLRAGALSFPRQGAAAGPDGNPVCAANVGCGSRVQRPAGPERMDQRRADERLSSFGASAEREPLAGRHPGGACFLQHHHRTADGGRFLEPPRSAPDGRCSRAGRQPLAGLARSWAPTPAPGSRHRLAAGLLVRLHLFRGDPGAGRATPGDAGSRNLQSNRQSLQPAFGGCAEHRPTGRHAGNDHRLHQAGRSASAGRCRSRLNA